MKRSQGRFITTHTGSLIRPPELVELGLKKLKGEPYDEARYEKLLREATIDVVAKQKAAGVDIPNEGEFGKSSWANYILERISGYEIRPNQLIPLVWLGRDRERFADFFAKDMPASATGSPAEVCVAPIKYQDYESIRRDLDNLKAGTTAAGVDEAFFTTVAPASGAYNGVNEYYPSEKEYIYALADALREEYKAIHAAGFLVQVDDAVLANMYDHIVSTKGDAEYKRWAQLRIDALNHALDGIPEDRVRYHICFGSWHVPHIADAPLDAMLPLVLQVKAGAYSIEAANVRHEHEVELWSKYKLPNGRALIPGIVTHHTTTVEHPELVAKRILRFAELVGPENVIAGTDCGFAQGQAVQRVHPSIMWAKLESLAEGARIASKKTWG
jgi:5-methyltetrahydropteroyltriglutamate--homocysteine methyltransferase